MTHATGPRHGNSVWSDTQIETLRALWGTMSAKEIGAKIGFSGNAVIGKAHRLYLPALANPVTSSTPFTAAEEAIIVANPHLSPQSLMVVLPGRSRDSIDGKRFRMRQAGLVPEFVRQAAPPRQKRTLSPTPPPAPPPRVPRGQCQWQIGKVPPYLQCDQPAIGVDDAGRACPEGAVWCVGHRRKVYHRPGREAA